VRGFITPAAQKFNPVPFAALEGIIAIGNPLCYIFGDLLEEPSMFGIGMPELLVLLGLALIILGPKKIPDLARGLGRAMREFKKATEEMKESLREETTELEDVKNSFVREIERAEEPEDIKEESESDREAVPAGAGAVTAEVAESTGEVDHTDGGKKPTQEEEPAPE
jgi:TatA/E family protein of Tat protein translocase